MCSINLCISKSSLPGDGFRLQRNLQLWLRLWLQAAGFRLQASGFRLQASGMGLFYKRLRLWLWLQLWLQLQLRLQLWPRIWLRLWLRLQLRLRREAPGVGTFVQKSGREGRMNQAVISLQLYWPPVIRSSAKTALHRSPFAVRRPQPIPEAFTFCVFSLGNVGAVSWDHYFKLVCVRLLEHETEKARLETEKARLETEKARLETEKARLETEKARLLQLYEDVSSRVIHVRRLVFCNCMRTLAVEWYTWEGSSSATVWGR